MILKSIKIENYKSFGEENNILVLDDINTIIGKNESGKSNIIECISSIDLTGINNSEFFKRFNKNTGRKPIISVVLAPTNKETKEYNLKKDTVISLYDQFDIKISGGLTDLIEQNTQFQNNKKRLDELDKGISFKEENNRQKYRKIVDMIQNAENSMFINYTYIDDILNRLNNVEAYKEISCCIKDCINNLNNIEKLLPRFIEINDLSLKSKYTKQYLTDGKESKAMLEHLLNCLNMTIDDLLEYWNIRNEADKLNFSEDFNEKLKEIINKFNEFYSQEKITMNAKFENDSLNFAIKTSKKYIDFEERSNGLKWYLNMYIQILSKTNSNIIRNYVILIDEPGVYLHVNAQKEILKLFEDLKEKNNQIIYTTHSPFMIYENKPYRTKILIKDENGNSNIGNKYYSLPHKMGSKAETLTPLLTAMGMNMNYNILSINNSKTNIITEGISDYNYIKGYFIQNKLDNEYNIIPSSGVENISNIVSIFIGWGCNFKVVLDQDGAGRGQYKVLTNRLSIKQNDLVFVDGTNTPSKQKVIIENIFSDEDKEKIGIKNDDYDKEKAYYSLETLKKIENNEFKYDENSIEKFNKIFNQLLEKNQ